MTSAANCFLAVTLRNPSQSVALMAHVQLRKAHSNARVLPVFYSDNYVSLLPGETQTMTVEAQTADLGGDVPIVGPGRLERDGQARLPSRVRAPSASCRTPGRSCERAAPASRAPRARTVSINCGGGAPGFYTFGDTPPQLMAGGFVADTDYTGGSTKTVGDAIDVSAAPCRATRRLPIRALGSLHLRAPSAAPAAGPELHRPPALCRDHLSRRRKAPLQRGYQRTARVDRIRRVRRGGRQKTKPSSRTSPASRPARRASRDRLHPRVGGRAEDQRHSSLPSPGAAWRTPSRPRLDLGPFVKADAANPVLAPLPRALTTR